jgi:hypothetical protein
LRHSRFSHEDRYIQTNGTFPATCQADFMIMARIGPYLTRTGHDLIIERDRNKLTGIVS